MTLRKTLETGALAHPAAVKAKSKPGESVSLSTLPLKPARARSATLKYRALCACLVGLSPVAFLLSACDTAPPAADRRPDSRPTATAPDAPQHEPAAKSQPTGPPEAPTDQETPPGPEEPELPEYVTIVARYDVQQRAAAEVRVEPGNRLVVNTRNVSRLHIDRDRVPLDRRRSISLQLDGQGLEWLAGSKVVEFERSVNGEWRPARPD